MRRVSHKTAAVDLRIVVVSPPPGVTFSLQGKPGELIDPIQSDGGDIAFDFSVRLGPPLPDGRPRFLGKLVQGPPTARFVYVCSGTMAGDAQSCWTRRAKVPLAGIGEELLRSGRRLEARIQGRARDGGPACATVPLLGGGWRASGG